MLEHRKAAKAAIHDAFYFMKYQEMLFGNKRAHFDHLLTIRFWRAEMAAKDNARSKGVRPAATPPQESLRFVNRNLTPDEKADHDLQNYQTGYIAGEWLKLTLLGYSTKVSWDAYSKCYQATLTVWNSANTNFGYGLSARGASPERACSLLLYKHYEVLKENWPDSYQARATDNEG